MNKYVIVASCNTRSCGLHDKSVSCFLAFLYIMLTIKQRFLLSLINFLLHQKIMSLLFWLCC